MEAALRKKAGLPATSRKNKADPEQGLTRPAAKHELKRPAAKHCRSVISGKPRPADGGLDSAFAFAAGRFKLALTSFASLAAGRFMPRLASW